MDSTVHRFYSHSPVASPVPGQIRHFIGGKPAQKRRCVRLSSTCLLSSLRPFSLLLRRPLSSLIPSFPLIPSSLVFSPLTFYPFIPLFIAIFAKSHTKLQDTKQRYLFSSFTYIQLYHDFCRGAVPSF